MRRQPVIAFFSSTGLSLSVVAAAWGQVDPPAIAPPPPAAPPAVATPAVQPDAAPRVAPGATAPAVVVQSASDPVVLRSEIRETFAELARLAQEVEALDEKIPVPPNAAELRQRALEQIRVNWKEASDQTARLPETDRVVYSRAIAVWDRDVVTSKELILAVDAIPADAGVAPAETAVIVPTEVPLKTKTIEAVSAQLARPNDATFPAEWDGAFDEAVSRYVFDDVVEMRDAEGLIKIVPFRAEWAFADGAWQLAFLRVDGQVSLDRELVSVIPVGERPALIYVDRQPEANRVAVGARKAVSDLKGAYLGYPGFLETSRTWTTTDGKTYQAKLLGAAPQGQGVVVTLQGFDEPATRVPLVRFTKSDQDYVVAWMSKKPKGVTPTISLP